MSINGVSSNNEVSRQVFDNRIRMVSVQELSEHIGFKTGTIYNWIYREKEFPYFKWGKAVRFNPTEVINWLNQRR